ncbi:MAG TPA: PAS domain-containing protein [Rhizomicrobium sp.]
MTERLERVGTEINPSELENETLAFLHRYWKDKRGTRTMPSRADIKASELKEHLGWIIFMEVLPDYSDFRYKLIGTLVNQYYLSDSTGKTVTEAFAQQSDGSAKAVAAMFRKCARDRVVVYAFGEAGWIGKGFEKFECISLPLSDDGETVNMILHAFVFDRPSVMLAREMARANGGVLPDVPSPRTAA